MADIGICNALIASLSNALPAQSQMITPAGTLLAALDPENQAGVDVVSPNKGDGKYSAEIVAGANVKRVKLRWYPPAIDDTKTTRDCNSSEPSQPSEIDFDVTKYRQTDFDVPFERLRALCDDASKVIGSGSNGVAFNIANTPIMNEIAKIAMSKVRALVRDINKDLIGVLKTKFGKNIRTGLLTAKDVTLFKADGSPSFDGITELFTDFMWNEMLGSPIIIGGAIWQKFFSLINWSGLSDTGVNFGLIPKPKFYADPLADDAVNGFGIDDACVIAPSMASFVQFKRNAGMFGQKMGTSEYGQFIINALPQIEFDLKVKEIDCNEEVFRFMISVDFDLFTAPDRYLVGDRAKGVNGIFRYNGIKL